MSTIDSVKMSDKTTLSHYGKIGMRWGHHTMSRGIQSQDAAKAARYSSRVKKSGVSSLSNDELKKLTTRIDLEKKYKTLNPSSIRKGQNVVNGVLATAGTITAVIALAKHPAVKAGFNALKAVAKATGK